MGEQIVERAKLAEPFVRDLRPDQRHAGNVVDGIAHQGLKIDDLFRPDSPFFLERCGIEDQILANVEHAHAIGNQLPAILVAGYQQAIPAGLFDHSRHGGQNVVGFEALALQNRNSQRRQHSPNVGNLRHQIARAFRMRCSL